MLYPRKWSPEITQAMRKVWCCFVICLHISTITVSKADKNPLVVERGEGEGEGQQQ
jgi:hypothetical protein